MKRHHVCFIAAAFLAAISCSEDDTTNNLVNVTPDPTEEVALNSATVSESLLIRNGTKKSGNAPSPTGTMPFTLDETTQSGFQKSGFDINFNAPSDYAGAYIQLKNNDGTAVGEYWDISSSKKSNATSSKFSKRTIFRTTTKNDDYDTQIDIDFKDAVQPGTFCYEICIYDADGNISEPVEVCVEVEAWGGNPNLIGTWTLSKEEIIEDGKTVTIAIGEEQCDESTTITCENGNDLVVDDAYCYTTTKAEVTFNADGTFSQSSDDIDKDIDRQASKDACEVIYEDLEEESYNSSGNWAYDEEEKILTLVTFKDSYSNDQGTFKETFENGEVFSIKLDEITTSTLKITDDEYIAEISTFFFNKK